MRHPIQPLSEDEHGTLRFRENRIVRFLLRYASACALSFRPYFAFIPTIW